MGIMLGVVFAGLAAATLLVAGHEHVTLRPPADR
jgi:hypothetical protein